MAGLRESGVKGRIAVNEEDERLDRIEVIDGCRAGQECLKASPTLII